MKLPCRGAPPYMGEEFHKHCVLGQTFSLETNEELKTMDDEREGAG